jgi:lysozyme
MNKHNIALGLIKRYEGFRLAAYKCPAGIWTIGYGRTAGVKPGDVTTVAKEEAYLLTEITKIDLFLNKVVVPHQTPQQMAALISFVYNIGQSAFASSTMLKLINADKPATEVAQQFARWNKANGKVLKGLTTRRAEEASYYLK